MEYTDSIEEKTLHKFDLLGHPQPGDELVHLTRESLGPVDVIVPQAQGGGVGQQLNILLTSRPVQQNDVVEGILQLWIWVVPACRMPIISNTTNPRSTP